MIAHCSQTDGHLPCCKKNPPCHWNREVCSTFDTQYWQVLGRMQSACFQSCTLRICKISSLCYAAKSLWSLLKDFTTRRHLPCYRTKLPRWKPTKHGCIKWPGKKLALRLVQSLTQRYSLLFCSSKDEIKEKMVWSGSEIHSRQELLEHITRMSCYLCVLVLYTNSSINTQEYIHPTIMLPKQRLPHLLAQAYEWQRLQCIYHNGGSMNEVSSIFVDHLCTQWVLLDLGTTLTQHFSF